MGRPREEGEIQLKDLDIYDGAPGWQKMPGWSRVQTGLNRYHQGVFLLLGSIASVLLAIFMLGYVFRVQTLWIIQLVWLLIILAYLGSQVLILLGLYHLRAAPPDSKSKLPFELAFAAGVLSAGSAVVGVGMFATASDLVAKAQALNTIQTLQIVTQITSLAGFMSFLYGINRLGWFIGRPDIGKSARNLVIFSIAMIVLPLFAKPLLYKLRGGFVVLVLLAVGLFFYLLLDVLARARDAVDVTDYVDADDF